MSQSGGTLTIPSANACGLTGNINYPRGITSDPIPAGTTITTSAGTSTPLGAKSYTGALCYLNFVVNFNPPTGHLTFDTNEPASTLTMTSLSPGTTYCIYNYRGLAPDSAAAPFIASDPLRQFSVKWPAEGDIQNNMNTVFGLAIVPVATGTTICS